MATKEASLAERVQSSYKQLSHAATNLNVASDDLNRAIAALNSSLEKLNLCISAWATISGADDGMTGEWWSRDLGYTQINDEWVIALRSASGNYQAPDHDSEKVWRFSEAPRWMQNEAIAKLPDLIDKLTTQAQNTRKKLKVRAEQTLELAAVIEQVSKSEEDWCSKLAGALSDAGNDSSAVTLTEPESSAAIINNQLRIKIPRRHEGKLTEEEVRDALDRLGHPDLRFKITTVPNRQIDKKTAEKSA